MTECTGRRCADVLPDGIHLCHKHTIDLEEDLRAVPSLWVDLRATISRQDATAASIGGGKSESKPCINLDAWDKAETLDSVLQGWLDALRESVGDSIAVPRMGAVYSADRLYTHVSLIRRQEWVGDLAEELRASINECRYATDRAADKITLGVCGNIIGDTECMGTVGAVVGATMARCSECRTVCDVKERQQWMIAESYHVAGSLRLIVQALRGLGQISASYETVKKRAQRGKLYGVCDVVSREHRYTAADVLNSCRE